MFILINIGRGRAGAGGNAPDILNSGRTPSTDRISGVHPRIRLLRRGEDMQRKASAIWHGTLKEGKGTISTESGLLKDAQYSFSTRFEDGKGTNPEELIAAAHAGCYSMALGNQLTNAKLPPETIETTAAVTLEKVEAGMTVTKIHLTTRAKVPGAS